MSALYQLPAAFTLPVNNRIRFMLTVNNATYSRDVPGLGSDWPVETLEGGYGPA